MARHRLPREVLERARAQATRVSSAEPDAPRRATSAQERPISTAAGAGKREKIVRALRKLHPMD